MNDHLSIETPEQVELNYSVAGIGSRFYAAMLDTLLLMLIVVIGGFVIVSAVVELDDIFGNWLAAIGGLVVFALFWGYYMIFEVTMNGQSPGKRALGLRVIKEGGYPVSFRRFGYSESGADNRFPSVLLRRRCHRYADEQKLAAPRRSCRWHHCRERQREIIKRRHSPAQ